MKRMLALLMLECLLALACEPSFDDTLELDGPFESCEIDEDCDSH